MIELRSVGYFFGLRGIAGKSQITNRRRVDIIAITELVSRALYNITSYETKSTFIVDIKKKKAAKTTININGYFNQSFMNN